MWKFLGQHAAAAFGATAATLAMTQAVRAGRRAAHSRDANYMARAAAQQMRDDADAILNALPRDRRLMPWAESQIARGSDRVHSVAQALRFSPTRGLVQDGRAATFGVRNALEGPQRGRRAKKSGRPALKKGTTVRLHSGLVLEDIEPNSKHVGWRGWDAKGGIDHPFTEEDVAAVKEWAHDPRTGRFVAAWPKGRSARGRRSEETFDTRRKAFPKKTHVFKDPSTSRVARVLRSGGFDPVTDNDYFIVVPGEQRGWRFSQSGASVRTGDPHHAQKLAVGWVYRGVLPRSAVKAGRS